MPRLKYVGTITGELTNITFAQRGLKIETTQEGRKWLAEKLDGFAGASETVLTDLLEEHLTSKNLFWVLPEQIAVTTDSPVFSDHWEYSDNAKWDYFGVLFWFPEYEFLDPVEVLLKEGEAFFPRVQN